MDKPVIIGCDEVGYGCLAGPLVVVGVRAPKDWNLAGLNDSKKLSAKKREALLPPLMQLVQNKVINYHLAERSNDYIDKVGVAVALKEAYVECFHALYQNDCLIISDGILKFDNLGVETYDKISIIKADTKFPAVMAASIIAKTWRDDKMHTLHHVYPAYGWDHNVGYGSKDHLQAIHAVGPCPLHRMSYAPMRNMVVL
jgi:ribonuclease HII